MSACIFCQIIEGNIPSHKIYEDAHVIAILDINPVNKGHSLVIPKIHSHCILEAKNDMAAHMMKVILHLSPHIQKMVKAQGINIQFNCEKEAGQVIFHTHGHIIPRFSGDGLRLWSQGYEYASQEMQSLANALQKQINEIGA